MNTWAVPKNNRKKNNSSSGWRPSADRETLKARVRLLQQTRSFFYERDVLEVETPILTTSGSTETHLDHFAVGSEAGGSNYYLNTSPELAMKRLLAAGSGDIFQLSKVFRAGEQGRQHQPEFTMLEWYRLGFDLKKLMTEVEQLFVELLADKLLRPSIAMTYAQAFEQFLSFNPFTVSVDKLRTCFEEHSQADAPLLNDKQAYLDLIMSHIVEPRFDADRLTFITQYPAEQASLARINKQDSRLAERFEVFAGGLELANGFHELSDAAEQRSRMLEENKRRVEINKTEIELDQHFLAALEAGLPDCSGVAVGFDRLVMFATGKQNIEEVISFAIKNSYMGKNS